MSSCRRPPRGWWCPLAYGHHSPCPAYPRWWNLRWQWVLHHNPHRRPRREDR